MKDCTSFSSELVDATSATEELLVVKGAIFSAKKSQQSSSLKSCPPQRSAAEGEQNYIKVNNQFHSGLPTSKKKYMKMDMVVVN